MIFEVLCFVSMANMVQVNPSKDEKPSENSNDIIASSDDSEIQNRSNPSPQAEDIVDEFDINAPFDETLDLGVDWPDTDQAIAIPDPKADSPPENNHQADFVSKKEETVIVSAEEVAGNEAAAIADENSIGENNIDNERTDLARQQELQFEDDIQITQQESDNGTASIRLDTQGAQSYKISFSGLEDVDTDRIFARFEQLSSLKIGAKQTANGSQILRRAKTDVELMDQLLRLEGYYDNLVVFRIESNSQNSANGTSIANLGAANLDVIIDVTPGAQYRYGEVTLPGIEASEDAAFIRDALVFEKGDVVQQDAIEQGRIALQNRLLDHGYPFGNVGEADLLIDHARREGDLTLPVSPDRKYDFGRIITKSDSILSGKHLEKIARFEQGDLFQQSNVDDLRQAIFATSLASNIVITPVASTDNVDQVDLNVELDPAPPRTIAGQFGFNTGEGLRVETSWEHRNFFPPEGAINIAGVLGTREQAAGILFRRSNFQGRDRVLTASFRARNQNLDAFDARTLAIGIGYERQTTLIFQKKWAYNVGVEYLLSDERATFGDSIRRELFNILAFPVGVGYDGSDDLLDPTKGFRLSARVAPEISTGIDEIAYFKSQIDGSIYQPLNDKTVIAARVRLASITGAQTSLIAPSRRNYAGGGGSVRGFGFQDIGPIDENGNPAGGRGLAEFAIEARYRIGSFGIVPFLDAGGVSNGSTPDFDDLRFAAGLGLRYYTSFGPIRIDVGTPFNRREGESVLAVAISLGQAF